MLPLFELVSVTLELAILRSKGTEKLTAHSYKGWQNKMQPNRTMLAYHGVTQSMRRKSNCFDNAVIKSLFG